MVVKSTYVYICSSCTCLSTSFTATLPDVPISGITSTDTSITVHIGARPSGIERVIIGYHRLDLGVPVVGEPKKDGYPPTMQIMIPARDIIISSLVPGAKYRITAWGLGGSGNRRRSQSPVVREVTTMEKSECIVIHPYICI